MSRGRSTAFAATTGAATEGKTMTTGTPAVRRWMISPVHDALFFIATPVLAFAILVPQILYPN